MAATAWNLKKCSEYVKNHIIDNHALNGKNRRNWEITPTSPPSPS
jgi:hypothetical protein